MFCFSQEVSMRFPTAFRQPLAIASGRKVRRRLENACSAGFIRLGDVSPTLIKEPRQLGGIDCHSRRGYHRHRMTVISIIMLIILAPAPTATPTATDAAGSTRPGARTARPRRAEPRGGAPGGAGTAGQPASRPAGHPATQPASRGDTLTGRPDFDAFLDFTVWVLIVIPLSFSISIESRT